MTKLEELEKKFPQLDYDENATLQAIYYGDNCYICGKVNLACKCEEPE